MGDHRVSAAVVTDVGPTRQRNEDAALVQGTILAAQPHGSWFGELPGPYSLIQVVDGMGAHGGGSMASALVALTMNEVLAATPEISEPEEFIAQSLQLVGDLVVDVGALRPQTRIMGAATVGLFIDGAAVYAYNVGDCRAYVEEGDYLSLISTDHRARVSGALTRSLGGTGKIEVITPALVKIDRLSPRRFLLCSDGLTDTLPFQDIKKLMTRDTALEVANALVNAAVRASSTDNITVAVVDVGMTPDEP